MKEEVYNKMVQKQMEKWNRERDKKLLKIAIKKEELEDCEYYRGLRFRGHGIAQWDNKLDRFIIIAYEWGVPVIEQLEHFVDVIEIKYDGFVPIEKLDKNKYYDIRHMDPNKIEKEVRNRRFE